MQKYFYKNVVIRDNNNIKYHNCPFRKLGIKKRPLEQGQPKGGPCSPEYLEKCSLTNTV